MSYNEDKIINQCLQQIADDDENIRLKAISELGDIGDELCLKELRDRLKFCFCCRSRPQNSPQIPPANIHAQSHHI